MAYDTLEIGSTPCDESCEQLGSDYRPEVAKIECQAFIGQLERMHGKAPKGAQFKVVGNDHDYGKYYEVGIRYNCESDEASDFAYKVEDDTPSEWDDQAMMYIDRHCGKLGIAPRFDARLTTPV